MNLAYEPLFTPFSIRNTRIKNRYFMAAMGTVTHNDEDGAYLPDAVDYFVRRAAGGVGLIITGANWVDNNIEVHSPGSFPCPTICPGKYIKAARELTDRVHAFDTKIFVQLTAGLGRSAMPAMIHDRKFVAPSTISNRWNPRIECRELTTEEVERLVEQFGVSAAIAKKCGYDGVEVHAVHEGYLLDCFAMSLFNKRTDKYGGDLNGRLRFAIEIVQKIKQYCGEDFPVILRFSLKSYIKDLRQGAVPGETFTELGRDTDEGLQAARILVDAGYDALDVDAGTYDSWYWAHPPVYMPPNCNIADVEHIKNFTTKPVVCAGKMEPEFAAKEIAEGRIDAMGVGRQNLVDPEWINKLLEDREEEIKPCINCHNACFNFNCSKGTPNMQPMDDALHLARCALTPPTMQHNKYKIVPTKNPKKVAIVGGGIGGMECALVLKKRGHTPVIYEKSDKLGGMYNYASAMSFKEADKKLLEWYDRELKKAGIEVHLNTEIDPINPLTRQYDEVIICTGAVPKKLPVPGFNKTITFEELLTGDKDHGDKVVFFGGGQSACEAAYELVLQGKHPIIVEYANDLIATPGTCLANASFLREMLVFKKVPIYLEHSICEIGDGYVMVKPRSGGDAFKVECDSVVNGLGFRPAPVAPAGKHVRQVGTAAKWGNLRNVIWGAWDVCMKI